MENWAWEKREGPCDIVPEKDVENTLYRRKTGKVVGAGEITADSLKFMGQDSIKRIRDVANGLLEGLKMQENWRKSDLAPLDKQKGNTRSCKNYRSVKLLEPGMNVIEKIFENFKTQICWTRCKWDLSHEKAQ